jgi:hypothetical protein
MFFLSLEDALMILKFKITVVENHTHYTKVFFKKNSASTEHNTTHGVEGWV